MSEKKHYFEELQITELSKKGNGLAKFANRTIEIPFTVPGDTIKAHLWKKKAGQYEGKLEEIVKPSQERIVPLCIHFGSCGGCRLQNLSYENQLKYKEAFVLKCFDSFKNEFVIHPIIPCKNPWHYRNKMEYSFSQDKSGNKFLGLILDSSKGKVFNIKECHLTSSWFVDALHAVKSWWDGSDLHAYHPPKNTGSLRTLTLREGMRTGDRMAVLTVSGNPEFALHKNHIESFVQTLKNAISPQISGDLSIFLRIHQAVKGQPTNMYEMHLEGKDHINEELIININEQKSKLTFSVGPSAFFQPNTYQAEIIYSRAFTLAQIQPDAIVYDLYCGAGTLGIAIAKHVKQVIGIEISRESVDDARTNLKLNNIDNVTIFSGAVHEVLNELLDGTLPLPDAIFVDPPRTGLDSKTIKHLIKLSPAKIVYISCNPVTQARDIAELTQNGFEIVALQPIDQFPQTFHLENIVLLKKTVPFLV